MKYPSATHYSEHFTRKELDCHCGCVTPAWVASNLVRLAQELERLRVAADRPLSVNDAYRCPRENKRVGGAAQSYHMQGKAADVDAGGTRVGVDRLADAAMKVPAFRSSGIGRYYEGHGLFVHVDYGPRLWHGINGV